MLAAGCLLCCARHWLHAPRTSGSCQLCPFKLLSPFALPLPPQVREVYEGAIEAQPPLALSDADTRTVCLRYAALERRLGEVDR